MTPQDIHIGSIIKAYIARNKITKSALARTMGRQPARIQDYEKKPTLQSSILLELSHVLKHNFFADIAAMLPGDYTTDIPPDSSKEAAMAALQQEIILLKAEKQALREAMAEIVGRIGDKG